MNIFTLECEPRFETCEFVHLLAQLEKGLSQGSSYGLTCVKPNKDTAIEAAKHPVGIIWLPMARQRPNF